MSKRGWIVGLIACLILLGIGLWACYTNQSGWFAPFLLIGFFGAVYCYGSIDAINWEERGRAQKEVK